MVVGLGEMVAPTEAKGGGWSELDHRDQENRGFGLSTDGELFAGQVSTLPIQKSKSLRQKGQTAISSVQGMRTQVQIYRD